jgi:FRG domain
VLADEEKSPVLQDILKRVSALDMQIRQKGSTAWYRGHRRAEWKLKSALHRHIEQLVSNLEEVREKEKVELLVEEGKTLYRRFKSDAWPLLGSRERSLWGIIFTMQHYKLPTRLLDWSSSFACALFFAQWQRERHDTASVWVLDGEALNEKSIGRRGIINLDDDAGPAIVDPTLYHPHYVQPLDLKTVAVHPIVINQRMTAQKSMFTMSGNSFCSLEDEFDGALRRDGVIETIELPPDSFDEVDDYLRLIGIRPSTYFPDLEGLGLDHQLRVAETLRDGFKYYSNQFKT